MVEVFVVFEMVMVEVFVVFVIFNVNLEDDNLMIYCLMKRAQ
jgi:hypothetical protein